jgi:hypothetical protein
LVQFFGLGRAGLQKKKFGAWNGLFKFYHFVLDWAWAFFCKIFQNEVSAELGFLRAGPGLFFK